MDSTFALFALIVLASFTTEAFAGFGSIVIAVTLGSHLYAIEEMLPLVVPTNLVLSGYLVARHRGHVAWRLLATGVLPLMGVGVALGLAAFGRFEGPGLKVGFGVLVAVMSGRELWLLVSRRELGAGRRPLGPALEWLLLVAAGVVHGIYASGGPLLVYVLGRAGLDKGAFRSTLSVVWLTLNAALAATYVATGRLASTHAPRLAVLVTVAVLAIACGEWLHHRVRERPFRIAVFTVLLLAGTSILLRA
jgi:hypothetical protein